MDFGRSINRGLGKIMPPKSLLESPLPLQSFRPSTIPVFSITALEGTSVIVHGQQHRWRYNLFIPVDQIDWVIPQASYLFNSWWCFNSFNKLIFSSTTFQTLGIPFTSYHYKTNYLLSWIVLNTFRFSLTTPFFSSNFLNFFPLHFAKNLLHSNTFSQIFFGASKSGQLHQFPFHFCHFFFRRNC